MHAIERELIKVTGYKLQRPFANRQDYLGSILNAVMKLTDSDFDNLSNEAALWANAAVEAKNSKEEELPDFDEAPDEVEAEEASEEASDDDDAEVDEDDTDHDPETGEVIEPDDEEGGDESEEEAPTARKSYKRPPKEKKTEKVIKPITKKFPGTEDVVLDKWGCMGGSKNSQALAMFEKGATTKEVKDKIGGTYYNILGKAVQNGHKMEKEGSLIKLTHKNDLGSKKPVKKKK